MSVRGVGRGRCISCAGSDAWLTRAGLGLVGPNGAGKSTLLRAIAGEVPPVAGKVSVNQRAAVGCAAARGLAQDVLRTGTAVLGRRRRAAVADPPDPLARGMYVQLFWDPVLSVPSWFCCAGL